MRKCFPLDHRGWENGIVATSVHGTFIPTSSSDENKWLVYLYTSTTGPQNTSRTLRTVYSWDTSYFLSPQYLFGRIKGLTVYRSILVSLSGPFPTRVERSLGAPANTSLCPLSAFATRGQHWEHFSPGLGFSFYSRAVFFIVSMVKAYVFMWSSWSRLWWYMI